MTIISSTENVYHESSNITAKDYTKKLKKAARAIRETIRKANM
jgi:hypothetical protein